MSDANVVESAATLQEQAQTPRTLGDGGVPFVLLPEGTTAASVEAFLAAPRRTRATVALREAASFIAYVNRFKDADSLVFANLADRTITAVLDYAGVQQPRWGQHRAQLTCLLTEDWKRWMATNKKAMTQVEFAQFLEDNLPNIAEPTGATIVEIARTLEAKKSVTFASSIRLETGEHQLLYEETISGTAQKGAVLIPPSFTLGLAPFVGGTPYRVDARWRYRLETGHIRMWIDLVRPDAVVEDAFAATVESITAAIAPALVLAGSVAG